MGSGEWEGGCICFILSNHTASMLSRERGRGRSDEGYMTKSNVSCPSICSLWTIDAIIIISGSPHSSQMKH